MPGSQDERATIFIPIYNRAHWLEQAGARAAMAGFACLLLAGCTAPKASGPSGNGSPLITTAVLALRREDPPAIGKSLYGAIVLNAWDYGLIPKLKAENPNTKVLVYKDMSSTRSYACHGGVDEPDLPTGVGYCQAAAEHPEWFLLDLTGKRVEWSGFSGHWWMDVGNPAYQEMWAAQVEGEMAARGWDGVFIDNALVTKQHYLARGKVLSRYTDDAALKAATDRFLAKVGPRLTAGGRLVIPNLGGGDATPQTFADWAKLTSGAMREFWSKWDFDEQGERFGGSAWELQLAQMEAVGAAERIFFAITYAPPADTATARYARASFLLGWNGGPAYLALVPTEPGTPSWTADWTADIGLPTGKRYAVGGAWRRDFTGGTVLVNPSAEPVRIELGKPFPGTQGPAGAIEMAPRSGAVLDASGAKG